MNHRTRISLRVLVGVGLLLFLGAVLADQLLPPVYFSKVTMELKPDNSGPIMVFGGGAEWRAQFIAAQLSILRSKEILNQVIKNLLLNEVWAKDEQPLTMEQAFVRLADAVEPRAIDDKGMIEIGVYDSDPQQAANIANTIAVVYQQKRLSDLQKIIDKGMEQLWKEVEKQRRRAVEADVDMTRIREADGIIDSDPNNLGASLDSPKGQESLNSYMEAKTRALQARRIYEAAKTKYDTEILEHGSDFDPAKIWEKAEPAVRPRRFTFRRLTHAFTR